MYLFNGICLTDNLVKNLHRQIVKIINNQKQIKKTAKISDLAPQLQMIVNF